MQNDIGNTNNSYIKLRGHHLLCFHGYRGLGYNQKFIDRLTWLKALFLSEPQAIVQIFSSPDVVCDACPHLSQDGCIKGDKPNQEERIQELDRRVMELAGISDGQKLTIEEAFTRVEKKITPDILHDLCKECEWLQYGYCSEGLRNGFWH